MCEVIGYHLHSGGRLVRHAVGVGLDEVAERCHIGTAAPRTEDREGLQALESFDSRDGALVDHLRLENQRKGPGRSQTVGQGWRPNASRPVPVSRVLASLITDEGLSHPKILA